jgi:hypothetical protein
VEICSPGRFSFKISEPWVFTAAFRNFELLQLR